MIWVLAPANVPGHFFSIFAAMETLELWLGMDWKSAGLIVLNLILIESLLSVGNAALLATMVMVLEKKDRRRALR